jgi:hypothetical protein
MSGAWIHKDEKPWTRQSLSLSQASLSSPPLALANQTGPSLTIPSRAGRLTCPHAARRLISRPAARRTQARAANR